MTALSDVLADFNRGEVFFEHLAPDVVVEFPYGPTLGLPSRIEGADAVRAHLTAVQTGGLTVHDAAIAPLADGRFLVEYAGAYRGVDGAVVRVPLVSVIEFDGRVHRIREYWDTHRLAMLNAPD